MIVIVLVIIIVISTIIFTMIALLTTICIIMSKHNIAIILLVFPFLGIFASVTALVKS